MSKLVKARRADNRSLSPLELLVERHRWESAPRAARLLGRRFRIRSVSTATAIAELAGFATGDDR